MTLYLTDNTPPEEVYRAKEAGIRAFKLYPAGATTNSDAGVTDIKNCFETLRAMEETGTILLMHGEVVDPKIDIFDRERVFIETTLQVIMNAFPNLRVSPPPDTPRPFHNTHDTRPHLPTYLPPPSPTEPPLTERLCSWFWSTSQRSTP